MGGRWVRLALWTTPAPSGVKRWLADMPSVHHLAGPCEGWLLPFAPPFWAVSKLQTGEYSVEQYQRALLAIYGRHAFAHRSNLARPGMLKGCLFQPRLEIPGAHTPRERRAHPLWRRAKQSGELTRHKPVGQGDVVVCRPGPACPLPAIHDALSQSGWRVELLGALRTCQEAS